MAILLVVLVILLMFIGAYIFYWCPLVWWLLVTILFVDIIL